MSLRITSSSQPVVRRTFRTMTVKPTNIVPSTKQSQSQIVPPKSPLLIGTNTFVQKPIVRKGCGCKR